MTRQYAALARHPAALQLHYEVAQRDFNGTLLRMVGGLYPQVGPLSSLPPACCLCGGTEVWGTWVGSWGRMRGGGCSRCGHREFGVRFGSARCAVASLLNE